MILLTESSPPALCLSDGWDSQIFSEEGICEPVSPARNWSYDGVLDHTVGRRHSQEADSGSLTTPLPPTLLVPSLGHVGFYTVSQALLRTGCAALGSLPPFRDPWPFLSEGIKSDCTSSKVPSNIDLYASMTLKFISLKKIFFGGDLSTLLEGKMHVRLISHKRQDSSCRGKGLIRSSGSSLGFGRSPC